MTNNQKKCSHPEIVSGTGMFQDGLICLKCGLERYPEKWPRRWFGLVGPKVLRMATPTDWIKIENLRKAFG